MHAWQPNVHALLVRQWLPFKLHLLSLLSAGKEIAFC